MKNILLFSLLLLCNMIVNSQVINFSDVNLKAKLLSSNSSNNIAINSSGYNIKIDANSNGEIEVSEALLVRELNINRPINSFIPAYQNLNGIENFTNLKKLDCSFNSVQTIDLTGLNQLEELFCSNNVISVINFADNTVLKHLVCWYNQLTNLNLSTLTDLRYCFCNYNNITSLDFTGLNQITDIAASNNNLTAINLNGLSTLTYLNISNNQMTNIDLSNLSAITILSIHNNQIANLDLTNSSTMGRLYVGNNPISELNLSNLNNLNYLEASNTLISNLDCSQTVVEQLFCMNNPNLISINVRNNIISYSEPDLLYFAFTIANNPLLETICVDLGEQNNLSYNNFSYNTSGNVIVFTGENCDVVTTVENMSVTSVDNTYAINIYPNPSSSNITIKTTKNALISSIYITNLMGQQIHFEQTSSLASEYVLNVANLSKGCYFVTTKCDNTISTSKFIKE